MNIILLVLVKRITWMKQKRSSDNSEEVTPVPMPNTVVKLFSADGSWA